MPRSIVLLSGKIGFLNHGSVALLQLIAIAAGGALGAVLRFIMTNGVHRVLGRDFPYGTLAVNVLGSFIIGILFVLLVEKLALSVIWRSALMIGVIGGFTTFATFSIETLALIESGALTKAFANILFSVVLCLGATWIGISLGRQL